MDEDAAKRRKESGWWGDQTHNFSNRLSIDNLKSTLRRKSSCPSLDSPGVYMYINKDNRKVYIGSAVNQTILQRQQQHLCSASHMEGHIGKFDAALSYNFDATQWEFYALPMQCSGRQEILGKERELILKCGSIYSRYGYNTQLPGGQ